MESWKWTALLLCCFGFFKEFRPSEPFVTEFLIDFKNITQEEVVQIAYPISTYTYLGVLPFVFLLTDFVRYRFVILLEGLGFVAVYAMLLWGEGLTNVKILEVFYGIAMACEVSYYSYIYAKVEKEHYQIVTSYTYSAIFIGNLVASIASQIFVSVDWMDYYDLNYLSLAGTGLAAILALFLPSVPQSTYFHPKHNTLSEEKAKATFHTRVRRVYAALFRDFKSAYSNAYILKWSIWWALATAIHLQITFYNQALWEVTSGGNPESQSWNGAVSSAQACLSAIFAIGVARLKVPWEKWGESTLSLISVIQGVCVIGMAKTENIYISYFLYVLFRIFYQVLITVASSEVATRISEESYALIFGINTFGAVVVQTLITICVSSEDGFALDERAQFMVYGTYNILLGLIFLSAACFSLFCKGNQIKPKRSLQPSDFHLPRSSFTY